MYFSFLKKFDDIVNDASDDEYEQADQRQLGGIRSLQIQYDDEGMEDLDGWARDQCEGGEDDEFMEMDGDGKKKKKKKEKVNCCQIAYLVGQKLFMYFFPGKQKKAKTHPGEKLRFYIGATVIGHMIFFFISLAIVGFIPMIQNLFFAAWTYSIYLTLYEFSLIAYMFCLVYFAWKDYQWEV